MIRRPPHPSSLIVYTDGACRGNPGPGGWGFVVYDQNMGFLFEDSGHEAHTTNNRMELMAAIGAVEYAIIAHSYAPSLAQHSENDLAEKPPTSVPIEIFTDSQYVRQGVTQWMHQWRRNNWRTRSGESVKNQDLWMRLHEVNAQLSITWQWVKGHAGHAGNERADALATAAARQSAAADAAPVSVGLDFADPPKPSHSQRHIGQAPTKPSNKNTTDNTRCYLQVPYAQKDAAKALGARWDPGKKQWFCFSHEQNTFSKWQ